MRFRQWRFPDETLAEITRRARKEGISEAVFVRRALDRDIGRLACLDEIAEVREEVAELRERLAQLEDRLNRQLRRLR